MKKIRVLILLMAALAVSLAAAQGSPGQNSNALKVALVFDIGGRGDGGFNDAAYQGLEKAVAELGVKAVYVEHRRNLELEHALNQIAASDAEMIIGVGFAFSNKLNTLAALYPDRKFVCVDYSAKVDDKGRMAPVPANLAGLLFKEEEGSYLVGAIAALTSKTGAIGFIGGMDGPLIRKFQAGYSAGARAVRPDVRVLSKFAGITAQAFNDPQKGYKLATRMYEEGADIIYQAAGVTGNGVFRAAKEKNQMAIGVDIDQSAMAPGLVLTSMTKNVGGAVFETVKSCVMGKFSGGLNTFGLKENGVGFIYNDQNRSLIPKETYERVLELQAKIISGDLVVPVESSHKPLLSQTDLQDILSLLHGEIVTALKRLDDDLQRSAQELSGRNLEGDYARNLLKRLYRTNPYLIDCETVSNKGIMLAFEPPEHKASEGADISAQAHIVRLFETRKPVMSASFRSVEGPEAVVIHHPIFSPDHQFAGSVSALFAPEYLLQSIIGPVSSNLPVTIFLMQTDGLVIYDVDARQIGLNVFHDPLYQPFPELIAFAKKTAAAKEGSGHYRFYQKGMKEPIKKMAVWRTVSMHGMQWRLVMACAQDTMEEGN